MLHHECRTAILELLGHADGKLFWICDRASGSTVRMAWCWGMHWTTGLLWHASDTPCMNHYLFLSMCPVSPHPLLHAWLQATLRAWTPSNPTPPSCRRSARTPQCWTMQQQHRHSIPCTDCYFFLYVDGQDHLYGLSKLTPIVADSPPWLVMWLNM